MPDEEIDNVEPSAAEPLDIQVSPIEAGHKTNYQYIHEDRYGNQITLHEGDPLSGQELNDLLAVSRAHQYNPQNWGDQWRLNTDNLTDAQKQIALASVEKPQFTQQQLDEWKDYGDPTKNINYVPPEQQVVSAPPPPPPVSAFPTRDPRTGRVTPAKKPSGITMQEYDLNDLYKLPKQIQLEIMEKFHKAAN